MSAKATEFVVLDRPINTEEEDLLGRSEFARALVSSIRQWDGRDSLTIGISGEWGSGKTSLKNLIVEELRRQKQAPAPEVVEFNPWEWSSQHKVAERFFKEVAQALGKADKTKQGRMRARRWGRYARTLTLSSGASFAAGKLVLFCAAVLSLLLGLSGVVPKLRFVGWVVFVFVGLGQFLSLSGKFVTPLAAIIEERVTESEATPFEEQKDALRRELATLTTNVLIIIDDIDRLSAEETKLLFQHVKANADFPHLVYLLLYDENILAGNLETAGFPGRAYVEKVVQQPFRIPAISQSGIDEILANGLNGIFPSDTDTQWDDGRWADLYLSCLQSFFRNLRDVKRFLVTLRFHVGLFRGRVFEANAIDLIAIEAISVFEPKVHQSILEAKQVLTSYTSGDSSAVNARLGEIVSAASDRHRGAVKALLGHLFPIADWAALSGTRFDSGRNAEEERRNLRICSPEIFDRYFQLGVPKNALSESEFTELLSKVTDRHKFATGLTLLRDRGLLPQALRRLVDEADHIELEHASQFLPAIFEVGDQIPDDQGQFMLNPGMLMWRAVIRYLLQAQDLKERGDTFCKAFAMTHAISVPGRLIAMSLEAHKKHDPDPVNLFIDSAHLEEAQRHWLQAIWETAQRDPSAIAKHPNLPLVLHMWKELGGASEAREWLISSIQDDSRLLELLVGLVLHGLSVSQRSVRRTSYIDLGNIESIVPLSRIEDRIAEIRADKLTGEQSEAIAAFKKAMQIHSSNTLN